MSRAAILGGTAQTLFWDDLPQAGVGVGSTIPKQVQMMYKVIADTTRPNPMLKKLFYYCAHCNASILAEHHSSYSSCMWGLGMPSHPRLDKHVS